jgi:uncharacterized protein
VTSEETRALIDELYATLRRGDRERLLQLFTPDAEWQMPASVPDGLLKGRERVVAELGTETVRRFFQKGTFKLTIHAIYVDKNVAIVQTGVHAMTKQDKVYEIEYAWIYTCHNGKIAHIREYLDTKRSADVLGWGSTP